MHALDETIALLRKKGFKLTPQRLAVIKYMIGNRNHPAAVSIYNELKRKNPGLSFSTVYNTLEMLEKIGEIQAICVSKGYLNYDPFTEMHNHFICGKCNRIFDIPVDSESKKCYDTAEIDGHRVESCSAVFRGICRECL